MNAYKQLIRVIYPRDRGRIALRTDKNWDVDVEAVSRRGSTTKFQIETGRPYFYFKPVLISGAVTTWSRGENCLAVATSGAPLEVHPFFREDTRCSVCELMPPLGQPVGPGTSVPRFSATWLSREHGETVPGPLHARWAESFLKGRSVRGKYMED